MSTYYKAVRADGTDFRTGAVDYASLSGTDQFLPELPGGKCCGPGVYHASTEASKTLIGGSWPCRLFLVEGEPVSESGSKRGFRTLRVLEELPAHLALGPNGKAVAALIECAKSLTEREAEELKAAWFAARSAARFAAWSAARFAAQNAARNAACDAVCDAVCALMARDLITEEQFDVLYGPWASVFGPEV